MTLRTVLVFGCVSVALCSPPAAKAPDYCSDPATRCQNFTTSIECNTVSHCLRKVWPLLHPTNGSCGGCETQVRIIRLTFDIKARLHMDELKKLCSAAPESAWRCHKLEQSTHQLLKVLQSDVDPAIVCRIIGSCFADSSTGAKVLQPELLERCSSSYWCHSLTTSKECKSTSYCIQNVWSKQKYDDDDYNLTCQSCQHSVEVQQIYHDYCKRISDKEASKDCNKKIFEPEVTEMLDFKMTATGICVVVGLCNSTRIDNLLKLRAAQESPGYCHNCTYALNAAQYFFRHAPRDQIQDKLLRVCNQLSSYSGACTNAVISSFDDIRKILTAELQLLPICRMCSRDLDNSTTSVSPTEALVAVQLDTIDANLSCDLCKQLVKHLKDVAVETTENEFQEVLQGVCQQTTSFRRECLRLASESSPILYQFVTKELDSEEGCHQLALCIRNTAVVGTQVMPGVQWAIKYFGCSFWKTIIGVLQRDRNEPQLENLILWVLFNECSTEPQRFQQECDFIHTEQVSPVIQILKTTEGFDSIALATTVCPDPAEQHKDLRPICEYVLHFVQEELAKPVEQQRIEEAMNRTCEWVPRSMETECQTFIAEYGALMISLFSQKVDPSVVCPALRLCPRTISLSERCTQCQEFLEDMKIKLGTSPEKSVLQMLDDLATEYRNLTLTGVELMVHHREDIERLMGTRYDAEKSCLLLQFCDEHF